MSSLYEHHRELHLIKSINNFNNIKVLLYPVYIYLNNYHNYL